MSLEALCNTHTVTFKRGAVVKDVAAGHTRETWTPVEGLTELRCTIQNAGHQEKWLFAQRNETLTSVIFIPGDYTARINRSHRIEDLASGRIYLLLSWEDEAGRGVLTKVYAKEYLK